MTEIDMLTAIFNRIKENGIKDEPVDGRLGGCWSADTYRLYGNIAMLADDGASMIVRREKFSANTTYGRPVEYSNGNKDDLTRFYNAMFPEAPLAVASKEEVEERSYYLWL